MQTLKIFRRISAVLGFVALALSFFLFDGTLHHNPPASVFWGMVVAGMCASLFGFAEFFGYDDDNSEFCRMVSFACYVTVWVTLIVQNEAITNMGISVLGIVVVMISVIASGLRFFTEITWASVKFNLFLIRRKERRMARVKITVE